MHRDAVNISNTRLDFHHESRENSRKVKLLYDPLGRIFRKEELEDQSLISATHYYYSGGSLIQEFDEMYENQSLVDELRWDYLRGGGGKVVRRRHRDEHGAETDMLHFNDMMGTAREEIKPTEAGSKHAGSPNGYVTNAYGEPLGVEQPSELENHIQFHGGFLEDSNFHTDPQTDGVMGHFYRMGIRHYSPSLGRFLQRDPLSYLRAPHKSNPLSLNPYIYAINRPTDLSDTSGYQPCPGGCGSAMGGISPDHIPPEFNTDPSGRNGTGDVYNHVVEPGQDTKATCDAPFPKECITDERYPYCSVECCRSSKHPFWWSGCCCGDCFSILINPCQTSGEGRCECACCWAGGEGNAPAMTGGGGITGRGSITAPIYGPPDLGPWGDGGDIWDIIPTPFLPPWWWGRLLSIQFNSIFSGSTDTSNLFVNTSLVGWPFKGPSDGYLPYRPGPGWGRPGGLYPGAAGWGIAGVAVAVTADQLQRHCTKLIGNKSSCKYISCLCPGCSRFDECWSRYSRVGLYAGFFGGIIGGIIGGATFGPGGIKPGVSGGISTAYGMGTAAAFAGCIYSAFHVYYRCIKSTA